MDITQYYIYIKYVGLLLAFGLVMYGYIKYNYVRRSIGWQFVDSIAKVKLGVGGCDLVLRIKHPSGKEEYQFVKQTKVISYQIKVKNEDVDKLVIFDGRAVDRLNGCPILTVTPNDIRPIDRETGLCVDIPSEIIIKLITDSTKTAEGQSKMDKNMKMLIYGLIAAVILTILGLSYINQTNADTMLLLKQCLVESAKTVTVIGK